MKNFAIIQNDRNRLFYYQNRLIFIFLIIFENLKIKNYSNKNIKKLNKVFRKKNKSTDILSFPSDKKIKITKNTYLGDIIISYNYLDKPRSQNLKSFKEKKMKSSCSCSCDNCKKGKCNQCTCKSCTCEGCDC